MKRIRHAILLSSVLALAALTGCGGAYEVGVGYGAPPPPIIEGPYGVAPGPDYIWTPGFYDWEGGRWAWRHGEWRRRPHPEDRWVAPHYERHRRGYVYHEGGWQHGDHFHH